MSARTSPVIAFGAAALGIAIYSVMDTLMKRLSIDSGAYSAVLWRSWVGVAITGALFLAKRGRWPAREVLALHIARGATGGAGEQLSRPLIIKASARGVQRPGSSCVMRGGFYLTRWVS